METNDSRKAKVFCPECGRALTGELSPNDELVVQCPKCSGLIISKYKRVKGKKIKNIKVINIR